MRLQVWRANASSAPASSSLSTAWRWLVAATCSSCSTDAFACETLTPAIVRVAVVTSSFLRASLSRRFTCYVRDDLFGCVSGIWTAGI
jgi:hypothetical protein